MRRSEREIRDQDEIRAILAREHVVRLAFAVDGEPYIVPLSYGYDADRHAICLHTAVAGRKIQCIEKSPRVCFEIEGPHETLRDDTACGWSLRYESLVGYGVLREVTDPDDKVQALSCLMRQQSGGRDGLPWEFRIDGIRATRVWRLAIESVVGKRAP